MANLLQKTHFHNALFQTAFGEYLTANGYAVTLGNKSILFGNQQTRVYITNDQADVYEYVPEEPGQENEKWVYKCGHTGISRLDIYGWMMLMHLTGVVSIKQFRVNSEKKGEQMLTEANFLINNCFKSQVQ